MIPRKVYDHIMNAAFSNHGAELERGNGGRTYLLKKEMDITRSAIGTDTRDYVRATMFIACANEADMNKLGDKGYITANHRGTFHAWKRIPLNQVPESQEAEWRCWDEY